MGGGGTRHSIGKSRNRTVVSRHTAIHFDTHCSSHCNTHCNTYCNTYCNSDYNTDYNTHCNTGYEHKGQARNDTDLEHCDVLKRVVVIYIMCFSFRYQKSSLIEKRNKPSMNPVK